MTSEQLSTIENHLKSLPKNTRDYVLYERSKTWFIHNFGWTDASSYNKFIKRLTRRLGI